MPEHRGAAEETVPHANPVPQTTPCSSAAQKSFTRAEHEVPSQRNKEPDTDAPLLA